MTVLSFPDTTKISVVPGGMVSPVHTIMRYGVCGD